MSVRRTGRSLVRIVRPTPPPDGKTFQVRTSPGAIVAITDGTQTGTVTANARGLATFVFTNAPTSIVTATATLSIPLKRGGVIVVTPPVQVVPAGRVAQISTYVGGRAAVVPDAYYDEMADEHANHANHLHLTGFTHTVVASGLWSSASTWSTGTLPGVNAVVNIPVGFTVVYDVESSVALKDIYYAGALKWSTTVDTKLVVDTIYGDMGSFLEIGSPENPVAESPVPGKPRVDITYKLTQTPSASNNTTLRGGLVTMGQVRFHGAEKPEKLICSVDPMAGATSVTVAGDATKWKVGDTILVLAMTNAGYSATDAQFNGPTEFYAQFNQFDIVNCKTGSINNDFIGYHLSHDEVRTITAINGQVISFATPLAYNHASASDTLPRGGTVTIPPMVANLSRSIRFQSADPVVDGIDNKGRHRAHMMFMHTDDIDVRWAEALNMGRTRVDATLFIPATNVQRFPAYNMGAYGTGMYSTLAAAQSNPKDETKNLADPDNVRGRYAWHIHGTGPFLGRKAVVFEGLTAHTGTATQVPQPGWALVHHNSRACIEKCITYNVRGAGIVSERGNEIGQWIGNISAWNRGDGFLYGWAKRAEMCPNHNGHQGVAYENQARQILQQDNWATSSWVGWMYLVQDIDWYHRNPGHREMRLFDPQSAAPGGGGIQPSDHGSTQVGDQYAYEGAQIPDWNNNVCAGVDVGFYVAHRQSPNRFDQTPLISRGFKTVATWRPVHIENYSHDYSFYDFGFLRGPGPDLAYQLTPVVDTTAWQIGEKTSMFNFANGVVKGYKYVGVAGVNLNGHYIDITHDCPAYPFPNNGDVTTTLSGAFLADPQTHPDYNLGGNTWVGNHGGVASKFLVRKNKIISSTSLPMSATPAFTVDTAPSTVPGFGSYALDLTLDALQGRLKNIVFKGTLQDKVSFTDETGNFTTRQYPHWQYPFSNETIWKVQYNNELPHRMVERNGVYKDGQNQWRMPMFFLDHERATGDYISIRQDPLVTNFDEAFLQANVIVPTAPALPLLPEAVLKPVKPALAIISPATKAVYAGDKLVNFALQATEMCRFEILSAGQNAASVNAADFEIVAGKLRFLNDGTKTFGGSNAYTLVVRATSYSGATVTQTITVTVLNSVTLGSADADVQAFFGRVATAGLAAPSAAWLTAYNTLVLAAKANGWWAKCDRLHVFGGYDRTVSLLNLRQDSYHASIVTQTPSTTMPMLWHAKKGFRGQNNNLLTTTYNPSLGGNVYGQNSAHHMIDIVDGQDSAFCFDLMIGGQSQFGNVLGADMGTDIYWRTNRNGNGSDAVGKTTTGPGGRLVINRSSSSAEQLYKNGAQISSFSSGSNAPISATEVIGGRLDVTPNLFQDRRYRASSVGSGMTLAQVQSQHADLNTFFATIANF